METIAVLMSTYNGERFLEEQINSILAQKGDFTIRLFVRDDGSQDTTKTILDKYASESKLEWYTGINMGPAHSFLDLLKKYPDYEYYAFADQDDFWMSDKIMCGVKALKNMSIPALYVGNAELVDESLISLKRNVYLRSPKIDFFTLMCAGGLLGCTMIFNRSLASLICEKDMPGEIVMHDFYLAALCSAVDGKIIYDPDAHMQYRQHENNVIGVSYGFLETLKSRFNDITKRSNIGIASQAKTLLELYRSEISLDKCNWLKKINSYPDSLFTRIALACSGKTKYANINMGIKLRLSILLGNR